MASVGAGQLLDWFRPALIIWLLAGAAAVLAVTAHSVGRSERGAETPAAPRAKPAAPPWRLASVIIGAALIQASHAAYYAFSSIHWAATGRSGTEIGLLWSTGVLAEIAFLLLGGRFFWAVGGPVIVLTIGGAGAALRWGAMALDPSLAVLVVLQLLHAITFGATHLGSVSLISRLAPPYLQARAQGWLAALWAGSMAALTALAGMVYPEMGERIYLPMAAVSLAGLAFVGIAARMRAGSAAPHPGEAETGASIEGTS